MDDKPQKPVNGGWYQLDLPPIVLPGYGGRLEIIPEALLYPSLGADPNNLVAIVARVVTEKVHAEFQWDATLAEFFALYESLKAFPGSSFEFPTLCGGGQASRSSRRDFMAGGLIAISGTATSSIQSDGPIWPCMSFLS
jgi:hypothetical protein